MLMKPRRWLAYSVKVNDLLPQYEQIVDRFEESDIPLDGSFGSSTCSGSEVPGILIAIGPSVEPLRLHEVLTLLEGLGQQFLVIHDEAVYNKVILVGALNLCAEPIVALSKDILNEIKREGATVSDLAKAIVSAPKIHVLPPQETKNEDK
jgi:hypothetical protein